MNKKQITAIIILILCAFMALAPIIGYLVTTNIIK